MSLATLPLAIPPNIRAFLDSKGASVLLLRVDLHEEPCLQIYSPKVEYMRLEDFKNSSLTGLPTAENEGILIVFGPDFSARFSLPGRLDFQLKGIIRKRIEIRNIAPIIQNICKVGYN